jgi:signal transduction histidine kinase
MASLLLTQPRWLAGVTWRLIGAVVAIACAFSTPFVLQTAFDAATRPLATLFLLSAIVAGLTLVFVGALLLDRPGPPWWRPLAVTVAVATGCLCGAALLVAGGDPYQHGYGISSLATWLYRARQMAPGWAFVAATWYFLDRATRRGALLREEERTRDQLVTRMLEARLQMLEAQVEPHFIFNTLANVKRLCRIDPPRARAMVDRFSAYLRASLPQMREGRATLGREVDLAAAYLDVQKVRMGRRLACTIDVPDALRPHPFPPMMLISLVENAIKHGLNPSIEGGALRIAAAEEKQVLRVSVADTGCGFTKSMGGGVGLSNIRARLAAMYAGRGALRLAANGARGTVATLELPLQDSRTAAAPRVEAVRL